MKTISKPLAIAALGLFWLAPPALAQVPSSTGSADLPSIRVSYADLDVESDPGFQTLTGRVDRAVTRVCGRSIGSVPLREQVDIMRCHRTARADAWRQFERNQERARALRGTLIASTATRSEAR